MKKNEVNYFYSTTNEVEIIYCQDSKIAYPKHNHISIYTIGIVLNGMIQLKRSNVITEYKEDDFFIISPYEPHIIQPANVKYSMITICIKKDFLIQQTIECLMLFFHKLTNSLLIEQLITSEQVKIFLQASNELIRNNIESDFHMDNDITEIRESLETHSEDKVSIEQLAKKIFVSKYYFIRKFKKYVGLSPHYFQLQNRIRKAQRLLARDRNVTQVALATGFYDQSHFIKCFKKIVGITPSEYLASISDNFIKI